MASGMSFMDALRVAAKTKEAPTEWFPTRGSWPSDQPEPIATPSPCLKKRKMCEQEPARLKPRTLAAMSKTTTSTSNAKLLVLPNLCARPARPEPQLSRALTAAPLSSMRQEYVDAPPLTRACTTVSHADRSDSRNVSVSSLPSSSECATVNDLHLPRQRGNFIVGNTQRGNFTSGFNFHDAASEWMTAVASSLRGQSMVPEQNQPPFQLRSGSDKSSSAKLTQELNFHLQQHLHGQMQENKPTLLEILQWESELSSPCNKKVRPSTAAAKPFQNDVFVPEVKQSQVVLPSQASVDADKLFIDELLVEFGAAESSEYDQEAIPAQPEPHVQEALATQQLEQQVLEMPAGEQPASEHSQMHASHETCHDRKRRPPPPMVDVANVAAMAPSMFADFMSTPAIPSCTPGWGSNGWDSAFPGVPPTPSGVPPTPSAVPPTPAAGGFASLWSEAWTDSFNVDMSNLAGNTSLW